MSDLAWKSAITKVEPNKLVVRGYRLDELIGKVSYAQMVYLLFKGELPSPQVGRVIEAILVSSVDHGTTPPSVLSAITVASTGAPLNAAVAAGILSISKFHGGAIEDCMHILQQAKKLMDEKGLNYEQAAAQVITEFREAKKRLSGFGHRIHNNDPRTKKLFQLAEENGVAGDYVKLALTFVEQLEKITGKHLPLNVDGAIAALLCELEIDPLLANAFFMIARVPGIVAHVYEEKTRYKPMRKIHPTEVEYDGPEERDFKQE
ncbi:MAG: citryl-CoA lyase [Caldisericaceae bacterium]|nr:citryl-CoA lyase [Caldisericaceae bacterium]